jgi:hypothetical protein
MANKRRSRDELKEVDALVERLRDFIRLNYTTAAEIRVRDSTVYSWLLGQARPAEPKRIIAFLDSLPLEGGNRLVKHRVDGPDGGSGYCQRNFPLIQRCILLSKRADQIRALMVGKMSVIRSFRAAATTSDFVQAIGEQLD